jgi:large subunit ribosomal protein L29
MSKTSITLEQLRDQPDEDLAQMLTRTRDELFRLRLGQHTNQVTSTAELRTKRRDIARIQTILRGRGLGIETQAQKQASDEAAGAEPGQTKKAQKAKKAKS